MRGRRAPSGHWAAPAAPRLPLPCPLRGGVAEHPRQRVRAARCRARRGLAKGQLRGTGSPPPPPPRARPQTATADAGFGRRRITASTAPSGGPRGRTRRGHGERRVHPTHGNPSQIHCIASQTGPSCLFLGKNPPVNPVPCAFLTAQGTVSKGWQPLVDAWGVSVRGVSRGHEDMPGSETGSPPRWCDWARNSHQTRVQDEARRRRVVLLCRGWCVFPWFIAKSCMRRS